MTLPGLVARNLLRRPIRTALTALGVAVGVALIVALLAIRAGVERTAGQLIHVEQESDREAKNLVGEMGQLFDVKTAATSEMELIRSRLVVSSAIRRSIQGREWGCTTADYGIYPRRGSTPLPGRRKVAERSPIEACAASYPACGARWCHPARRR